jgi:hypothetical protein
VITKLVARSLVLSSSYSVNVLFPVYGKKYENSSIFSVRNNFMSSFTFQLWKGFPISMKVSKVKQCHSVNTQCHSVNTQCHSGIGRNKSSEIGRKPKRGSTITWLCSSVFVWFYIQMASLVQYKWTLRLFALWFIILFCYFVLDL